MTQLYEIDPWGIRINKTQYLSAKPGAFCTLMSISNGYLGQRGTFLTGADQSEQGHFVNGVYGITETGERVLVNLPDYSAVDLVINGQTLDLNSDDVTTFEWLLDLHNATVTRSLIWIQDQAELRLTLMHFLSQEISDLAAFEVKVEVLTGHANIACNLTLKPQLDQSKKTPWPLFRVANRQVLKAQKALMLRGTVPTTASAFDLLLHTDMQTEGHFKKTLLDTKQDYGDHYEGVLDAGQTVTWQKLVVVASGVLTNQNLIQTYGLRQLERALSQGYEGLLASQNRLWSTFWEHNDVVIEGDQTLQQSIRYNLAHLYMQQPKDRSAHWTANGLSQPENSEATSQTLLFALKTYLSMAGQDGAAQFISDWVAQLPTARERAQKMGLQGALFPLSLLGDHEKKENFPLSAQSIFSNALVVYGIAEYMNYTDDQTFLKGPGVEILVAIAEFWASRVDYLPAKDGFTFLGVTGPNRFEISTNDQWFTNLMTRWSLQYTRAVLKKMPGDRLAQLNVTAAKQKQWADMVTKMIVPEANDRGIFPQSLSYVAKMMPAGGGLLPGQAISEDQFMRFPYIQQPDVLLGLLLLRERFNTETLKHNYDYYEPLTLEQGDMNANVAAMLAADLGRASEFVRILESSLQRDLQNPLGGLHLDTMTTSWLAFLYGVAGARVANGQLSLNPFCPKGWGRCTFQMQFRKRRLQITVTPDVTEVRLLAGFPLTIMLEDKAIILE